MATGNIKANIIDGSRNWLPAPHNVLIQLWRNGTELAHEGTYSANAITVTFEVHDNLSDQFRVVAYTKGYSQGGFTPVNLVAANTTSVALMLVPENPKFDFADAQPDKLPDTGFQLDDLLTRSNAVFNSRASYDALLNSTAADDKLAFAALLNITTALNDIPTPLHPLKYLSEIIWDNLRDAPRPTRPQPDRFFGFVDPQLKSEILALGKQFSEEKNPAASGHPGATSSYKQNLFGEANVQITFHENTKKDSKIMVEIDMDYFADQLSHFFLEYVRNAISRKKTDPRTVYALRWMAARQNGKPFTPPFRLIA